MRSHTTVDLLEKSSGRYKNRHATLCHPNSICSHRLPSLQRSPRLPQATQTSEMNHALLMVLVTTVAILGANSAPIFARTQRFSPHAQPGINSAGMVLGAPLQYPVHHAVHQELEEYCAMYFCENVYDDACMVRCLHDFSGSISV